MTNNIFNYKYKSFSTAMERLELLLEQKEKLNNNNLNVDVSIVKSVYNYWNLKLHIYNGKKDTKGRSFQAEMVYDDEC